VRKLVSLARELGVPVAQLLRCREAGRLPVVQFAAGGIATPADAALMMRLGCDGVFVGSGIFTSSDPRRRAEAIVEAVAHYDDPSVLARVFLGNRRGHGGNGRAPSRAGGAPAGSGGVTVRIGVVAFQGAWGEHLRLLERSGAEGFPLRSGPLPEDLAGVVLPGGESTVIGRHLAASGLSAALAAGIDAGLPALGTCAGAILLARRLEGPAPEGRIPRVPFLVRRNAWGGGAPQSGTQRDSFEGVLSWNDGKAPGASSSGRLASTSRKRA
jgi:pyridoxal 5'-phosphate synthase glutaminase subunit Pdx2